MKLYHNNYTEHDNISYVREHICSTGTFRCELVLLGPGEGLSTRVHRLKDEVCFLLEGKLDAVVDGKSITLGMEDILHIGQGEIHSLQNPYDRMAKMILISTEMKHSDTVEL